MHRRGRGRLIAGSITGCNFISSAWSCNEMASDESRKSSGTRRVRANGFPCTTTRVRIRPRNDFTGEAPKAAVERLTSWSWRSSQAQWPCNLPGCLCAYQPSVYTLVDTGSLACRRNVYTCALREIAVWILIIFVSRETPIHPLFFAHPSSIIPLSNDVDL